eukprot:TRINITY_DN1893_c0_g1::TRINITY_DN1893_c0_g1_i1::g.14085::m.14085 TRINITY_DN1893_c0_g1::TRINITY_DN1893_c0_g1_i1::g.14085  ORF type:complete len:462 (+),score=115.67,sp/P83852/CBPD_LOPSP/42.01/6e-92,Peptidase_M14/PF00246.19/1e-67,AstE_AspA/PF04952.9/5.8e-09,CarboxypepD_reg/PF13620.1/2.8e+03,CarboxypepD_reg/PF13620.1/1.8e-07,DUF4480/PF13715.1/0.00028,DUF2817/PF10994.3/0.00066,PEGA/PF08308.6/0.072 TRINITY_DN1893_c0_g1_i1:33-1388(+)
MELKFLIFFALILSLVSAIPISVIPSNDLTIAQIKYDSRADLVHLANLGIEVVERPKNGIVTVQVSRSQFSELDEIFDIEESESENDVKPPPEGYMRYDELVGYLQNITKAHPTIARLFSIGKTHQGRDLWVMELSDNVGNREALEPEFLYVGNMHGDEIVGREMLLRLIKKLAEGYGVNERVTRALDNTRVFILPSMNPDGFEVGTRSNARGQDLNRNFPDQFHDPNDSTDGREPETQAVMEFIRSIHPVLGGNLHGGTLVVNYPLDSNPRVVPVYTPSPDDTLYVQLSLNYSRLNPPMYASKEFEQGITNGAEWYPVLGGLQDWSYIYEGMMHVTFEVSHVKSPAYSEIDQFWADNEEALMVYLEAVHMGIKGTVVCENGIVPNAAITIVGNAQTVNTEEQHGNFYRILLPGVYEVVVSAEGYMPEVQIVEVKAGEITVLPPIMLSVAH